MRDELMPRSAFGGMKGVEEGKGKGHGPKHQPSHQILGLETGALFPRLHVKETNKVGPRAPPRNKMALYEQLTIPSHRFMTSSLPIPSSTRKAGSAPQYSVYDGRYLHPQSSFAYTGVAPARPCMGQPSLGSSTSTVVDCDELQRVPGASQVDSSAPSPVPASSSPLPTYSPRQPKHVVGKKHRIGDDFTVPTYSAPQISKRGTLLLQTSVMKGMEECPVEPGCCPPRQVQAECMKGDGPGIRHVEEATQSVTSEDQICTDKYSNLDLEDHCHMPQNAEGCGNLQVTPSGVKSLPHGSSWNDKQLLYRAHCEEKSCCDFRNCASHRSSMPGVVSCTGSDECVTAWCRDPRVDRETTLDYQRDSKIPESTVADMKQSRLIDSGSCDVLPCMPKASVNGHKYQEFHRSKSLSFESSGDSEHHTSGSGVQISEPSQVGGSTGDDSDSSMVDCVSIQRITPTDVIGAVGQQEFWRTRKAILRQQRIFSVQIFELHRLVKVQQLMAISPTAEYVVSGGCHGFVPANPMVKVCGKSTVLDHETCNDELDSGKLLSRTAVESDCLTARDCSGKDVTGSVNMESQAQICQGSLSQVSGFATRMASGWGYPSYVGVGVHPWLGPMSARPGALMYQYPASFSPNPAALLGAYGPYRPLVNPSNQLEVSPLMCFGLPSYEKWSELFSESYPRYNTITSRHPAMYYSSTAATSDPLSPWYFPHGPPPNYTERLCDSKLLNEIELYSAARHCPSNTVKPVVHRASSGNGGDFHTQNSGSAFRPKTFLDSSRLNLQAQSGRKSSHQKVATPNNLELSSVQAEEHWTMGQPDVDSFDRNVSTEEMSHMQGTSATDQAQRAQRSQKRARDVLPHLGTDAGYVTVDRVESSLGVRHPLPLFPVVPVHNSGDKSQERCLQVAGENRIAVVKIAPRAVVATPESAAGILLSIQQERRR